MRIAFDHRSSEDECCGDGVGADAPAPTSSLEVRVILCVCVWMGVRGDRSGVGEEWHCLRTRWRRYEKKEGMRAGAMMKIDRCVKGIWSAPTNWLVVQS